MLAHSLEIKIQIANIQIFNDRPFSSQLSGGFLIKRNIQERKRTHLTSVKWAFFFLIERAKNIKVYVIMCI